MANSNITPSQRAVLFAQNTREYKQELPSMTFKEGQTVSMQFPKSRFLSKVMLRIKGTFTAKHASKTTFTKAPFDMYRLLRQVRLEINNGFSPFQIGGAELSLYNLLNSYSSPKADTFGLSKLENTVSSAGATDNVCFYVELPVTINDRDPVGLILLQNEQTVVTLTVDCGNLADLTSDTDIDFTGANNITITPVLQTFSVPRIPEAIPDYSVIKIVNEQVATVTSAGETSISLPVGLTYRKLLLYIASDNDFTAVSHANLDRFQLVMNTADIPYMVSADQVAYDNKMDYAGQLPAGAYCFDMSSQGIANLGGGRDYIDTDGITQFDLKVNFKSVSGNNYIYIVSEKLAKLV